MIDYIKGTLAEIMPTDAVIETAGVGYGIHIALPTFSTLVGKENSEVKLFVTEIIREDTHELFGFPTKGERALFELLMTVSGVGANTARMILSAFLAGEVRQIIATANTRALGQVKGLGPKTAQRIIVDLKDKVLKIDLGEESKVDSGEPTDALFPIEENPIKEEAVSALTMLGFSAVASGKVVDKILKSEPALKVEAVIRQALKML